MAILNLTLNTGRAISANRLYVAATYAGLMEGLPDAAMNDDRIGWLPHTAASIFGDAPVLVVEPRRVKKEYPSLKPPRAGEFLPTYWIAAEFTSSPCREGMASDLVLIWFQDEPFPIPSEAALKQLSGIEWESAARDFEH